MRKTLVYDLPIRIFHWLFAASFVVAFIIAKSVDDESSTYAYHMLLGIFMATMVVLRIIWGLVGPEHARFTSFPVSPSSLLSYGKELFVEKPKKYIGHNPASSLAALVMFFCSLGLAFSGYMMVEMNSKHFYEEVHEVFAHLFLIAAIMHVAGVVFHTLRFKDIIGLSMITGYKNVTEESDKSHGMGSHNIFAGIIFLAIVLSTASLLLNNYNITTGQLQIGQAKFNLVEIENETEGGEYNDGDNKGDDD